MVGGWGPAEEYIDGTETLVEGGSAWTNHLASLPAVGDAGVLTFNNIPYLFGGWDDDDMKSAILAWDDTTKTWNKVGDMIKARAYHKVSLIETDLATLDICQSD